MDLLNRGGVQRREIEGQTVDALAICFEYAPAGGLGAFIKRDQVQGVERSNFSKFLISKSEAEMQSLDVAIALAARSKAR